MSFYKNIFSFCILLSTVSSILFAQEGSVLERMREKKNTPTATGIISGTLTDSETGEALVGASVFVVGTKFGASADIEGKFQIKGIPAGTYDIRCSFIGYTSQTITAIQIKENETYKFTVALKAESVSGDEVVVSADVIRSGEGAILAERKKAVSIGDGISSEQMKKAPDATSGDALKRVTGVTLVDNKYVFVRGVTDRYNQTTLNGASVTSTSADKKSFSFDMLPSNLIENMNVAKTATPDLPGDFTGGLVQVNTLDVPEKMSVKLTVGTSLNSITTFKDFYRTQGGNSDWFGSDDGTRAFPQQKLSSSELGKTLPNTWGTKLAKGPLAQSFSISAGNKFDFDESQLGIIAALSYRNNYQHSAISIVEYGNRQLRRNVSGSSDKVSVLWGGIFDVSYKFAENHKFSIKNNLNRSAEDKAYRMSGYNAADDENIRSYQSEWEQRTMYSGQAGGEHFFSNFYETRMDWIAFYSDALTEQPDRKELVYSVSPYSDEPYTAKPGERSWGTIYEKNRGAKSNITVPVSFGKIKFGILQEHRLKNFGMEFYQIQLSNPINSYLNILPIDSIYRQENFGAGKFFLHPFSNASGAYTGNQNLFAYYLMTDIPFTVADLNFRFTGGARVERSAQEISTKQGRLGSASVNSTVATTDVLPSANLTYIISERQNLRLAYSHTVNRPEFREMSALYFYDFDKSEYVHGNPAIKRALIKNYDIRYEIFPSFTDLFAVSYFYKALTNPIEEFRTFTSFTERTWINTATGTNYGWELELRKNLGFIGEYFIGSQIVANYTRILSSIPFRENKGNSVTPEIIEGERPMQGQSPYMYNISLFFTEPTLGTSFNILYNEYGTRIDAVGDIRAGDGDVYEQKRGTVDLTITQPLSELLKGLEMKYSSKNLNNQPIVYTQGKEVHRRHNVGISHSLQLSYTF